MASAPTSLPVVRKFGETSRRDNWWVQPLVVFLVLGGFVVYATWAAFQNANYVYGPYLSPFYSPEFPKPGWWPGWLVFSPALLILWMPGGFRLTCYYYRGAYYKAFWLDPPNCTVGEPRSSYLGERYLPLVLQNIHRYFLYLALAFIVVLAIDAYHAFWFKIGDGPASSFGIRVGSLVLTMNVILLGGYTLGCHSFRHLVGGWVDQLTKTPIRHKAYDCVSCLNRKHMAWAWCSLIWVAFTDLYVRLCAMEIWTDIKIL